MAYNLKITVFNNRDYEQSFTLKDADGVVIDLTGYTLAFAIASSTATLTSHSTATPLTNECIFITNALTGEIKLVLPYSILSAIEAGIYNHDLVLTDASGKRQGLCSGTITIKKGYAA